MESVISPNVFYLMNVLTSLNYYADVIGFTLTKMYLVSICIYVVGRSAGMFGLAFLDWIDEKQTSIKKLNKVILIIICVCLVFVILIPSQETMMYMLVADMITYDNIKLTADGVKSAIDYLIQQIGTLIQQTK